MSTIAAISTPFGKGGISVIRISGENAISVAGEMFKPVGGKKLSDSDGFRAFYGRIIKNGSVIDDGIATVFRAPHSFTGEDTVEISCHGGILLTQRVLEAVFECGAVQAQAGEFSLRAFMNGKMSLSEAEAVIGLIEAESDERLRLASSHANGVLKKRCDELYGRILHLLSSVYVKLDYPEEELAEVSDGEIKSELLSIAGELDGLISTYKRGKAVSEGVKTALVGKPNVGKSSILNMLCGEERAIVTSKAGTTRDVIEEKVNCGRVILRLFDTAGIRQSDDEIERMGIERARAKASEAELIIAVFDASVPLDGQDKEVAEIVKTAINDGKSVLLVLNKSDKAPCFNENDVTALCGGAKNGLKATYCSTVLSEGADEIKALCEGFFAEGEMDYLGCAVLANARQLASVTEARRAVENALNAMEASFTADICGLDLEAALSALGGVDGRTVSGEITDAVFHNFCVGK